jgi:LacI family transcriptional regulator
LHRRFGTGAAAALEKMMRGGATGRPSSTVMIHGENEIVRRASTPAETTSGPLVQKALAFIERNAQRGIGVKDVQEHLRVSRSLMDLRFREVRGESVLSVILSARLAELKRLLRETDDSIESITRRLGWTSPNYPKNLFRKSFGMSMREFRNSTKAFSSP